MGKGDKTACLRRGEKEFWIIRRFLSHFPVQRKKRNSPSNLSVEMEGKSRLTIYKSSIEEFLRLFNVLQFDIPQVIQDLFRPFDLFFLNQNIQIPAGTGERG